MRKTVFEPCIPTRGTDVPAGADWFHEIKHDGYRLTVQREGKRMRMFTRSGNDWTDRFPLVTEAALRNRISSFVIDDEAVLLGIEDDPTSTACIAANTTTKCGSMPLISSLCRTRICGNFRCISARTILPGCWRAASMAFSYQLAVTAAPGPSRVLHSVMNGNAFRRLLC